MKLVFLYFLITLEAFAANPFEDFMFMGRPLDLNNDGVADLIREKITNEEQVITFNPSWDSGFRKVTYIRPNKTDIKRFRNGTILSHLVEVKNANTKRIIESIDYEKFVNGDAYKKVRTIWKLDEKEITHFKKINGQWIEEKKQNEKIEVYFQGVGGCETNIFPLSEPGSGLFGSLQDILNFSKYLHPTTIGLRIDSKSCSKVAIAQFDEAIDIIYNKYLPCLSSKRPEFAERFITGLQSNQNRVYCERGGKGTVGAYTYSKPDADIIVPHHTENGFNRTSEHFANMIFHEILHHHFKVDPKLHNHGDVNDPVYGCTSLCSGYEIDDVKEMENDIFRGFSEKGCEACLEAPYLDGSQDEIANPSQYQCKENSIIYHKNKCESFLSESECRNKFTVTKIAHPNFQKCLDKGVEAKDCIWLDIYNLESNFKSVSQFFDHPNFKLCLSKVRFQSRCMKDIQDLDLLNDPEVLSCMEIAPKDKRSYCFLEILRRDILNNTLEP